VTRNIVVVGTGGHARELLDVIEAMNVEEPGLFHMLGFLDDALERHGRLVRGHAVLGSVEWLETRRHDPPWFVVGIGSPAARRLTAARAEQFGARPATLVHPSAVIAHNVRIGEGSVVTANATLTCDITLGVQVHVNIAATISHDCIVGDYALLGPGSHLAGNVRVGAGCDVGIGAVVIQGLEVGEWSIVGAGTVVVQSVPANVTVVGAPARVVKTRPAGWHLTSN